ncbi:hypothetical protein DPX16_9210 [Anabarilius grahami]|uniref:Uncharacterized protein n=1 Tax=Anabarilius grahami TaxID=495550 RepID=A0A3N0Y703_ANAGA|nr:hypothetical protein DPX16_9210 [Anabarilius grahami]
MEMLCLLWLLVSLVRLSPALPVSQEPEESPADRRVTGCDTITGLGRALYPPYLQDTFINSEPSPAWKRTLEIVSHSRQVRSEDYHG